MLQAENLTVVNEKTGYPIIEQVSFSLEKGTTLGIVGESGCGKSVTGLTLLRLLPPALKQTEGQVKFEEKEIFTLSRKEFRKLRGKTFSMVFQNALNGLNPLMQVGRQVSEIYEEIEGDSRELAKQKTMELFEQVYLPNPQMLYSKFPHQLSGGQKQRVMIALAVATHPKVLVADEPTTALDSKTKGEILTLLREIGEKEQLSLVYISHDIASVAALCDRVMVMYNGKVVEQGTVKEVLAHPKHPYTIGLLQSVVKAEYKGTPLQSIEGRVLRLEEKANIKGCYFASRCSLVTAECARRVQVKEISQTHTVACNHSDKTHEL